MNEIIRTEHLANGLKIEFFDRSNRYYGDFHRVFIEAVCRIALTEEILAQTGVTDDERRLARERLGDEVVFSRNLEQMGVAGDCLDDVKRDLVASFIRTTAPYLEKSDFPSRLLKRELEKAVKVRRFPSPGP